MVKFGKPVLILFCIILVVINTILCVNMYTGHNGYLTPGTMFIYNPLVNGISLIFGFIMALKLARSNVNLGRETIVYIGLPFLCAILIIVVGVNSTTSGC